MTLEEIYYSGKINIRIYNVCNANRLRDLNSIITYYKLNRTFINLKNCGNKSNLELIDLCINFRNNNLNIILEDKNDKDHIEYNHINSIISNLTRAQREIISSFIEININNLSARSKHALISFLNKDIKFRNICNKILLDKHFSIQDIKNIGSKSDFEIDSFIKLINNFIEYISNISDENKLIALKYKFYIEKIFSLSNVPNYIIESISIFKLINYLICQNVIFEDNKNLTFLKSFKVYQNQSKVKLDEISEELKISRERVRQIRKKILEELSDKLKFVRDIEEDLLPKYNIDINKEFIYIDEELSDSINRRSETNFSKEFISYIIYIYKNDIYSIIGDIDDVLLTNFNKKSNRHNWKNFYLIKKEIINAFKFNEFADNIDKRINERIEETYKLNFKSYLLNFMTDSSLDLIEQVIEIAELITINEFEIYLDLEDNLVFTRNTIKTIPEYAIQALENLGVPSKIEEIYTIIEKNYPDITKSKEALRGSLQRTPDIIYFGRSSTYGLKKWETEKEGIKGGTIKDIILDYLENKNYPVHILELLNEVHRYREETNAKNIITNLKLDPKNQFIIFNQSFIGLSRKSYNSKLSNLPKYLGKSITHYIKQNGRINRLNAENYFADQLNISLENMNYIIEYLIENNFIKIDNQNNLTI